MRFNIFSEKTEASETMKIGEYRKLKAKRRAPYANHEHLMQVEVFSVLRNWRNLEKYPFLKFIFAIPNGGYRTAAAAGKAKAEGVLSGVLDICCPFARKGYHGLWVELKHGKNDLQNTQKEFMRHLLAEGYAARACWNAEDTLFQFEDYLDIELIRF